MKVIDRLIAEDVSGQSDDDYYFSNDMQWRIDNEPIARHEYTIAAENTMELASRLSMSPFILLNL
jgi:hypothetical protein